MGNPMTDGTTAAAGFGSTPGERDAARKTVCHFATDVAEAKDMLAMLGLLDEVQHDPGRCRVCGAELSLKQMSPKWGLKGTCGKACKRRMLQGAA